jgi:hypothetical protein
MVRLVWCCVLVLLALPASAADFSNWAAVVVAGDYHAHSGDPSEVFDNGRQTIADELAGMGFSPGNIAQFSARPERYPAVRPNQSTPQRIAGALWDLSNRTTGGCFVYFTSHGSQDGIVVGDDVMSPEHMADAVDNACSGRPSVVVVSACYSGVFVPALSAPDRIVLTAAAADRSSFGCGQTDRYTYFDTCAVTWLPKVGDFVTFARDTIACVREREKRERVELPSHPQLAVGPKAPAELPHWDKLARSGAGRALPAERGRPDGLP